MTPWRICEATTRPPRRDPVNRYRAAHILLALLGGSGAAHGFGPEGHRIAGLLAQARLCEEARTAVEALGRGDGLEELGLWADRIRSEEQWAHTASWHFMNIGDRASLERYRHPPQGDVLWAITHFGDRLADFSLPAEQRLDALRFLAHFVVDIHQPLHVGRAADRGGNTLLVDAGVGSRVSLHRFWDSEVIRRTELSREAYVRALSGAIETNAPEWLQTTPVDWARESQDARPSVYDFERRRNRLTDEYIEAAIALTRLRLSQAGVRLAGEVNRALGACR